MKKIICILLLVFIAVSPCLAKKVNRVDADKQVDLSGKWNDTDARIVTESLIEQALGSGGFEAYKEELGRRPVITGGSFRNDTSEYIDTSILTEGITTAILNSGKARFKTDKRNLEEIRNARAEDQSWQVDMSQQKEVANELVRDLMLTGSIKSIVDTDKATRDFFGKNFKNFSVDISIK